MSTGSYRQRKGQDPAHWLPRDHRCAYAALYVQAKATYRLAVDHAEKTALSGVLWGLLTQTACRARRRGSTTTSRARSSTPPAGSSSPATRTRSSAGR